MKTPLFTLTGLLAVVLPGLAAPRQTASAAPYVAHEWGTFTSVQGADGVQLEWNPLVVSDLPKFVYDFGHPLGRAGKLVLPSFFTPSKSGMISRQRMETPVIYFYADAPRTVDVEVTFPQGRITEWYPQLANVKSSPIPRRGDRVQGALRWGGVELLPGQGQAEAARFPQDGTGSHYYAARETDASALRVKKADGVEETEKFLFYRGVGQFEAPLRVTHSGERAERLRLQNQGRQPLGPFFIYAVRDGRAAFLAQPELKPGALLDADFKFDALARPVAEVRSELAGQLRTALTAAGLYEKEAAAMVKTWDDSWLGESGLRVLYLLPQKWSDEILPLKITPAPREIKRVFVGRAEVITPAQEWALLKETVKFAEGGSLQKKEAATAVADIGLGRFADAAARRLQRSGPATREFAQALWGVLEAGRAGDAKPQPATALTR